MPTNSRITSGKQLENGQIYICIYIHIYLWKTAEYFPDYSRVDLNEFSVNQKSKIIVLYDCFYKDSLNFTEAPTSQYRKKHALSATSEN